MHNWSKGRSKGIEKKSTRSQKRGDKRRNGTVENMKEAKQKGISTQQVEVSWFIIREGKFKAYNYNRIMDAIL